MRAVVVSFDHLPVGFLGCYGNTWVDSPHFDRLAAEGVVFDQHFAECIGPSPSHAWWTGSLQFPAKGEAVRGAEFAPRLREKGVRTTLLTEEPDDRSIALPREFDEVETVAGEDGLQVSPGETPFAKLVDRAIERLQASDEAELLWLKSRGVPVPWLPPRDFAERFVALFEDLEDEEDDEPRPGDDLEWIALEDLVDEEEDEVEGAADDESFDEDDADWDEEGVDEAAEEVDEQAEFDEMLRVLASVGRMENTDRLDESDWLLVRAVYGGYVSLLDESLGRLRAALPDDVLLIVTAAEGESLGERIGFESDAGGLGEEHVHTPLLLRVPETAGGARVRDFAQPIDLAPTLLEWFEVAEPAAGCEGRSLLPAARDAPLKPRDIVVSGKPSGPSLGLRTSDYHLASAWATGETGVNADERPRQLFAKPEDVWEIHDMADQLPDEARRLAAAADQIVRAATSGCPVSISLPDSEVTPDDD